MNVRTYFMPKILTRELVYVAGLTLIMLVDSAFTLGYHAPLEPHADNLVTPLHTTSPWYFLWIQGLMKLGDKFIFGAAPAHNGRVIICACYLLTYLKIRHNACFGY